MAHKIPVFSEIHLFFLNLFMSKIRTVLFISFGVFVISNLLKIKKEGKDSSYKLEVFRFKLNRKKKA